MLDRRDSRTAAVQFLHGCDLEASRDQLQGANLAHSWAFENLPQRLRGFWELHMETRAAVRGYAEDLIRGVIKNHGELDGMLTEVVENYRLERMPVVDRNIARVALFEMFHGKVPAPVAINEAIELGKLLNGKESGRFLNGVLDRLSKRMPAKTQLPS